MSDDLKLHKKIFLKPLILFGTYTVKWITHVVYYII